MNFRRILGVFLWLMLAMAAHAADLVTERAWIEDRTGQMTLAEARHSTETPFDTRYFSQGFSRSIYWLRFRIDPANLASQSKSSKDELVIRIRPPLQDRIQLFDPLDQQDRERLTGDYFDWENDEYRSLNLNFVIPVGHEPRDVWLKLQTHQSTMTMVEVMTMDQARAADRRQELGAMLYFAILVICMGWAFLSYISQKNRLVGAYVIREILAIFYASIMLGYGRVFSSGWLPTIWLDPLSNCILFLFVAYVIWFDTLLIMEFKPNIWLIRAARVLPFALPFQIVLFLSGKAEAAQAINAYVVLSAIVLILCAALSTRAWDETKNAPPDERPVFSKTFLVSIYALVFLIILANRLPIMGFVPAHELVLYLALAYVLLSSVAMMVLVQVRAQRMAKRQQQAQRQVEFAEREAEQERARRAEQSNFLKMLAHEMKTPLSVVHMAVSNVQVPERTNNLIDRAIADMNGVIERLLQVERLQDRQMVLHKSHIDLINLVESICVGAPQGGRVQLVGPASLWIDTDEHFLRIVLSNLIDNATKYSPPDSVILVVCEKSDTLALISIENDLSAVGAPDLARVFDKYYRSEHAHALTGSGLGLYLVKELTKMLSGDVRCSVVGQRIRFELTLPLVLA